MRKDMNLTYDPAYEAVAPDDFPAMLAPERYGKRSSAFDKIISATNDHFWDPMDPKYVDFSKPFDVEKTLIMPEETIIEFKCGVADRVAPRDRVKFGNLINHQMLSGLLHGEQAATNLSASLCHILLDPGAQEYAANQCREEARHVAGFSKYLISRFGYIRPAGGEVRRLLTELVMTPIVWKKLVGMQMVLEGIAMGSFASIFRNTQDPVMRTMIQFVMTDEAFHHKFGKIWADKTIPHLPEEERIQIEDWAWSVFQSLMANLNSPELKRDIYIQFGLDWRWVEERFAEAMQDAISRKSLNKSNSVYRTFVKTLLKAGIITDRTASNYAALVDMEGLRSEADGTVGDAIADEGIRHLREINKTGGSFVSVNAAE
ncbi:MAG: ferritin-like domain-containing protein [Alphaproteobacteria bacterium]